MATRWRRYSGPLFISGMRRACEVGWPGRTYCTEFCVVLFVIAQHFIDIPCNFYAHERRINCFSGKKHCSPWQQRFNCSYANHLIWCWADELLHYVGGPHYLWWYCKLKSTDIFNICIGPDSGRALKSLKNASFFTHRGCHLRVQPGRVWFMWSFRHVASSELNRHKQNERK